SNASLLTRSHAVYSAKKRAKKEQIQEVVFDDDARREYLTGFRKRNLLKKEAKKKHAQERDRVEKLELRKQHRRELAERAAQNVREVEGAFGVLPEEPTLNPEIIDHNEKTQQEELEFEDEEQLAIVTVVEDFAADSLRHPEPQRPADTDSPEQENKSASRSVSRTVRKKGILTSKSKPKSKSNKVRYETKAARKVERAKQKGRRTEKAERAGGKRK
ncbi:nucleolar protein 12-domain-containing protein, partial [Gautieria morchelliformis]